MKKKWLFTTLIRFLYLFIYFEIFRSLEGEGEGEGRRGPGSIIDIIGTLAGSWAQYSPAPEINRNERKCCWFITGRDTRANCQNKWISLLWENLPGSDWQKQKENMKNNMLYVFTIKVWYCNCKLFGYNRQDRAWQNC